MSGHTPGPWFRIPAHSAIWVDGRKSVAVCVMTTGDYEANANLIAAAPCLLEALEFVAKNCAADLTHSEADKIIAVARKAIARAKGEA